MPPSPKFKSPAFNCYYAQETSNIWAIYIIYIYHSEWTGQLSDDMVSPDCRKYALPYSEFNCWNLEWQGSSKPSHGNTWICANIVLKKHVTYNKITCFVYILLCELCFRIKQHITHVWFYMVVASTDIQTGKQKQRLSSHPTILQWRDMSKRIHFVHIFLLCWFIHIDIINRWYNWSTSRLQYRKLH